MNYYLLFTLFLISTSKYMHAQSYCEYGWGKYLDKCLTMDEAMRSYSDAINSCSYFAPGATLLTIHSQQEQDILFTKGKLNDSIWIGAKVSNKKVTWVDGSKDDFTNWKTGMPSNATDNCVKMDRDSAGKWVDEPCSNKYIYYCQNDLQWSPKQMNQMLNELRANQTNMQQGIKDLDENLNNIVPIGFIYVQLPNQPDPKVLWPKLDWDNITPQYAGLFFRAEGGNSTEFNDNIQDADSPRLVSVDRHFNKVNETGYSTSITPGVYSTDLFTGGLTGDYVYLNFLVSNTEVRPRNQAIRIWKRIQ